MMEVLLAPSSGSVSGFTLDDTESVAWTVTLEESAIDNCGTFGARLKWTSVPVCRKMLLIRSHPGGWQGSFYTPDTDSSTVAEDKRYPGSAAGTFDADTPNAALVGGFGVTKQ